MPVGRAPSQYSVVVAGFLFLLGVCSMYRWCLGKLVRQSFVVACGHAQCAAVLDRTLLLCIGAQIGGVGALCTAVDAAELHILL